MGEPVFLCGFWPEVKLLTQASTEDSWTLTGKSDSVSSGGIAPFSGFLVHTRSCVCVCVCVCVCAFQESFFPSFV